MTSRGPVVGALVGPTASGKSALALGLARETDIELVSMDSMQVYRGMDIGTAKPTADERAVVRHHLIDLVEPHEQMSVAQFQAAYRLVLDDLTARGRHGLLVGGTGLYLRAAIDDLEIPGQFPDARARLDADQDTVALHDRLCELDPVAASRMEPTNRRRILRALEVTVGSGRPFSSYGPGLDTYPPRSFPMVGVRLPRPIIDERIERRYGDQMAAGFLAEVQELVAGSQGLSPTARQALGYRELLGHVEDGLDLEEQIKAAITRTRRFARRQERWFRRDPRVIWIDGDTPEDLRAPMAEILEMGSPSPSPGCETA
jgi:tRNA dimethylallyltransferase